MSVRLKAFTRIFFGALGLFGNPEILPGGSGLAQVNFGTPTNIACQSSPKELFIADFNRDGKLDVGSKVSSGVNLLFGFGNGALSDIALKHTNTVGDVMAIGDFNNDGNLDFVLVGLYFTHIILNDGKSGMNFWTNLNGYSVYPSAVAVADFNGDGRLDMVVSTSGTASMCVLINKGNGTFWDPVYYNGRGSDDHISLQAGDFDRDGNLDVAVINANSHSVTIWRNNGNGTFTSANTYALAFAPCSIACADFNCDKKLDLIIRGNSNVVVLLGRGDATFTVGLKMTVASGATRRGTIGVGDFNRDGAPDIALTAYNENSIVVMLNQSMPVLEISRSQSFNQITWATTLATNFILEYATTNFAPESWRPFPYPPVFISDKKAVTDWTDQRTKYYRLRKP